MMRWLGFILLLSYLTMLAVMAFAGKVSAAPLPEQLVETRYCGPPQRNADGTIKRSSAVLAAFQRIHPCPSTGLTSGACTGWAKNHIIPLACGGCDAVSNLVWLPGDIKSCGGSHCVDRYERNISALDPPLPDTGACVNRVVP